MSAALIGAACLPPPLARADRGEPSSHEMQWTESDNIHLADQQGAINRRGDIRIRAEVFASNKVIVSETGTRSEHNLYSGFQTDETTSWSNTWTGTSRVSGEMMHLELKLDGRTCTHQKTTQGDSPRPLPCRKVSQKLHLACQAKEVRIEDWIGSRLVQETVRVWTCGPTDEAELGETPSRWVLGRASCVQVLGGRHGGGYKRCDDARK